LFLWESSQSNASRLLSSVLRSERAVQVEALKETRY
jgi:hypothetical protein